MAWNYLLYSFISACSKRLGIYQEKCGLENVVMSWGHDGELKYFSDVAPLLEVMYEIHMVSFDLDLSVGIPTLSLCRQI